MLRVAVLQKKVPGLASRNLGAGPPAGATGEHPKFTDSDEQK